MCQKILDCSLKSYMKQHHPIVNWVKWFVGALINFCTANKVQHEQKKKKKVLKAHKSKKHFPIDGCSACYQLQDDSSHRNKTSSVFFSGRILAPWKHCSVSITNYKPQKASRTHQILYFHPRYGHIPLRKRVKTARNWSDGVCKRATPLKWKVK